MRRKFSLVGAIAAVTVALSAAPAQADTIDRGSCSAGSTLNAARLACSYTLSCGTIPLFGECLVEARMRVDGIGLVGGSVSVTPLYRCLFFDPCGPPSRPTTDSCQHVTSCEAAIAGGYSHADLDQPTAREITAIRVDCAATGPALLNKLTCVGLTDS